MNTRDLLQNPIWCAEELGHPIPASPHAISVALPRWQDVVGYEEKKPEVMSRLQLGYPRFVIHPLVRQLAERIQPGVSGLPFPSPLTARAAGDFVRRQTREPVKIKSARQTWGVFTNGRGFPALKAFWQHTGLIVSSRESEAQLTGRAYDPDAPELRQRLREQLAQLYDCAPDDVFLTPTGMAAQYAALMAALKRRPGHPTVQLGFPYVDTLKVQEKFGAGVTLLHNLATAENDLRALLSRQALAACFCEIPGNPLLGSVDVRRISPILREHSVPLIADDVVATPFNIDLNPSADLVATSLTKYIAGTGDVMGGAVICNPRSPFYDDLQPILRAQHEELLWAGDARVLLEQIQSFPERMRRHNETGLLIAERLRAHPQVERTWYPRWEFNEAYDAVRRADGGWGSLITFLPKNAETRSPRIYDLMAVCKGPSLGTRFSLACPFTLLAHYTELDWAETCGVSRHLIRISIGLEDPETLWTRLASALETDGTL